MLEGSLILWHKGGWVKGEFAQLLLGAWEGRDVIGPRYRGRVGGEGRTLSPDGCEERGRHLVVNWAREQERGKQNPNGRFFVNW